MDSLLKKVPCNDRPGLFVHQGVVHTKSRRKDILENLHAWPCEEQDIFIAAYPKCGSNWVQTIVQAICVADNLETFTADGMAGITRGPFEFTSVQEHADQFPSPRVFHTHLVPSVLPSALKEKSMRVIHLIRNPYDVAVSFYHFYRTNSNLGCYKGSWDEFFPYFDTGNLDYGDFYTFNMDWLKNSHGIKVKLLKYEDLITNPNQVVSSLAEFLDKPVTAKQVENIVKITSFDEMRNSSHLNLETGNFCNPETSRFIRKGKIGDWKNYFSEEQRRKAGVRYRDFVEKTGVTFRFE